MTMRDKRQTTMGVNFDGSAWVRHGETIYRVYPTVEKAEYLPRDYCVGIDEGSDVLDHDEVRRAAHDAFIDAYGGR
jgi:hypothetical protein